MTRPLQLLIAKTFRQSICCLLCSTVLACQPNSISVLNSESPSPSPLPISPGQSKTETLPSVSSNVPAQRPNSQVASPKPTADKTPPPDPVNKTPRPNSAFRSIFPTLKYQTKIPIVLPGDIPGVEPGQLLYAILETATKTKYQILLAFTEDCGGGNACRLGSVSGQVASGLSPLEGRPVALGQNITGYFVESTCGANCSDATLSWEQDGCRYTVGLKAGSQLALIKMANSAIANGFL